MVCPVEQITTFRVLSAPEYRGNFAPEKRCKNYQYEVQNYFTFVYRSALLGSL